MSRFALGPVADPGSFRDPVRIDSVPPETAVAMLRLMRLIRTTEEFVGRMVESGEVRCPCHLSIGQEAAAVGVGAALDPGLDRFFGGHRSHAYYLALGAPVGELIAEVLGKSTGCSRGMGGSMHLVAPEYGLLGTVPIVGAAIPLAVGAALAAKMRGSSGVAVASFGDGATEEGVFHESLNLAASMSLPVVFACENNLFSSHLHIRHRQPSDQVSRFAHAHEIEYEVVDGNDVVAVWEAAERAVERARKTSSPTLLEMVTYRWRGHVGHREDLDVGVKRSEDLPEWKCRDPIQRLEGSLEAAGLLDRAAREALNATVDAEVAEAVERARVEPTPSPDVMEQYLYEER